MTTHAIALSAPAAISRMVIAVTIAGTIRASGLLAKCPFNHSMLPRRSTILSMPDCRKRIARNAETAVCRRWIAPSGVCMFGIELLWDRQLLSRKILQYKKNRDAVIRVPEISNLSCDYL